VSSPVPAEEARNEPGGKIQAIAVAFDQGESLDDAALKAISGLGPDLAAGSADADGLKLSVILFDEVGRPKGGKALPRHTGNSVVSRGINVRVGQ
jgi:hypothetical protein